MDRNKHTNKHTRGRGERGRRHDVGGERPQKPTQAPNSSAPCWCNQADRMILPPRRLQCTYFFCCLIFMRRKQSFAVKKPSIPRRINPIGYSKKVMKCSREQTMSCEDVFVCNVCCSLGPTAAAGP